MKRRRRHPIAFSPEIQFRELSEPQNIFLIAESQTIPVGYAQLVSNSRDASIKGTRPLEIRRIYAVREYMVKDVGKELMSNSIQEARQKGCHCIWLGVWEKNQRTIDFYRSWGFVKQGLIGSNSETVHGWIL